MALQTSIYTSILTAVKNVIVAVTDLTDATVRIRKKPVVGVDEPLPLVLVTPEQEKEVERDTRGLLVIDYPVLITTVFAGNQLLETDVARLLDWREAIRFALDRRTLSGVTSVVDVTLDFTPTFDFPRYKAELDASAVRMTFRSSESWNP